MARNVQAPVHKWDYEWSRRRCQWEAAAGGGPRRLTSDSTE